MVRLRLLVLINSQLLLKYTKKIHSLSRKVGTFIHYYNLEVNEYSFRLCTMGLCYGSRSLEPSRPRAAWLRTLQQGNEPLTAKKFQNFKWAKSSPHSSPGSIANFLVHGSHMENDAGRGGGVNSPSPSYVQYILKLPK